MQEYLLRFSTRREGRKVVGVEVIRKTGPFPNQANLMKGTYQIAGTRGLTITYNDIQTEGDEDVEVDGKKVLSKTVELDVLYASDGLVAFQTEGEEDFFVLTPIEDIRQKQSQLLGRERARFFFN